MTGMMPADARVRGGGLGEGGWGVGARGCGVGVGGWGVGVVGLGGNTDEVGVTRAKRP